MLLSCGGSNSTPTSYDPGDVSTVTGTAYNQQEGFEVTDYLGQPEGPNLVYIEGGRTILGAREENLFHDGNNLERTVTVTSFYMDETEIANIHWLEYLYYINRKIRYQCYYQCFLLLILSWSLSLQAYLY